MGIFCMIFGGLIFLACLAGGYFLPLINISGMHLVSAPDSQIGYVVLYGICAFVGLVLGLPMFMQGLTYRKLCVVARRRRRRSDL